MGEQPPDDTGLPLHRIEVPVTVAPPDREPGNEVVEHEVVQDDETRCPPQRLDDPSVRVGIVADVVNAEIDTVRRALAAATDDLDLGPLAQRGHEQRRVVRDARPLRWHGLK